MASFSPLSLASTLLELSASPAGAAQICGDDACMAGLLSLLTSDNEEALELAMKASVRLCSVKENRERLMRQRGFLLKVSQIAAHDNKNIRNIAGELLELMNADVNMKGQTSVSGSFSTPMRPSHRSSVNSLGVRYLFTIPVTITGIASQREQVEKFLIAYRGIISVNLGKTGSCSLYSKVSAGDLMPGLVVAVAAAFPGVAVAWTSEDNNAEQENEQPKIKPLPKSLPLSKPQSSAEPSSSPAPAPSLASVAALSYSRALTVHPSNRESASLSAKFAARQRKFTAPVNQEAAPSNGAVKNLISSVSSFFW